MPLATLFALLSLSTASAQTFVTSVGTEQIPSGPDIGGMNWIRIFNNFEDGGWWLTYHWSDGTIPGYNAAPMTEDFELDIHSRRRLAEWDDIKDHGIKRCPDGSFLHAYSIGVTNDSARAARYSSDWSILAQGWIEEDVTTRAHNDMPIICSEPLQAAAFTNHSDFSATVFEIDAEARATIAGSFSGSGHVSGSSWEYVASRDQYLVLSESGDGLRWTYYNRDFSLAETGDFIVSSSLDRHFWPQGLMRLGDYWIVAFLGHQPDAHYLAGDGDVYVAVLNDSFETMESHKVSDNVPGESGSARPNFARHGSDLVVVWDKQILPHVVKLQLDLSAFGVESDDTGFTDGSGSGGDSPADEEGYDPCTESPPDTSDVEPDSEDSASAGIDEDDGTGGSDIGGEMEGSTDEEGGTSTTSVGGEPMDTSEEMDDGCPKEGGCNCTTASAPEPRWLLMVMLTSLGAVMRRR